MRGSEYLLFAGCLMAGSLWLSGQEIPRADLRPIPAPDTENLEEAVREQITTAQSLLSDALDDTELKRVDLSDLYGELGRVYQLYQFYPAAEACYRNARFLSPGDARWHHYLGVVYQQTGKATAAELSFDMALALDPSDDAARLLRGNLRLDLDQGDLAEQDFRAALEKDGSSAAAHTGLGRVLLRRGDFQEAVDHFEAALELAPKADSLHYFLAQAYRGLGNLEAAQAHLEKRGEVGVAVDDPLMDYVKNLIQGEVVHLLRGRQAFSNEDFAAAAEEFQKALDAAPESIRARVNLSSALTKLGRFPEARNLLEEVLARQPGHNTAHFNLGSLAYFQGDYKTAIEQLSIYREAFPNDLQAAAIQGLALAKANRPEEALPLLEVVNSNAPGNEQVRLTLVNLKLSQGQYAEALQILKAANQKYPSQGITALALARFLAVVPQPELRDGQEAYRLALQVYQAQPLPQHAAVVAEALAEMGRCESAVRWQQTAISLAEKQSDTTLSDQLKADLTYYQENRPCRPGLPPG